MDSISFFITYFSRGPARLSNSSGISNEFCLFELALTLMKPTFFVDYVFGRFFFALFSSKCIKNVLI
jgi:hypothetical protein